MRKLTNYLVILSIVIGITLAGNKPGFPADSPGATFTPPAVVSLEPFFREILRQVAERSADLAYDYDTRPLIRTIVMDFHDQSGREIAVGNELSAYLRSGLDQENQFFIYGRE